MFLLLNNILQMFDALIITASFALDIATLKPVAGVAGEGAIAFIMIFLLWRILHVINGEDKQSYLRFDQDNFLELMPDLFLDISVEYHL
jgi:hypothetical protein